MTFLNILGISDAFAATSTTATPNSGLATLLPMMLVFFVGAYFVMIRPQQKRMKAHRKLVSELSKGDEVVTIGGMVGKISKMSEDFVVISVSENVDINMQKSAIANVLPKGTMKSISE